MGSLVGIFIRMANIDGQIDESEIEVAVQGLRKFTDRDINPAIEKYLYVSAKLDKARMFDYLTVNFKFFKKNISANIKFGILIELAAIANADGVIHQNETILFNCVAQELGI